MSRHSNQPQPRQPRRIRWRLVLVAGGIALVICACLFRFRTGSGANALAQSSNPQTTEQVAGSAPQAPVSTSEYSQQVVAYIYGQLPITREELGEYLIARMGAEKLELLVNKKIIEHACREKNIEVTAKEVEAALADDLRGLNVPLEDFINRVLKSYKKTLLEWKEDVIRPKLLMTKLVRDQVTYTEEELHMAYDAHYGEKVDGRIIFWPNGEYSQVMNMYPSIQNSEAEFIAKAKAQASPRLAARAGKLEKPIGHHTTGNDQLEREAFGLQPGEVTSVIQGKEGVVVFRCEERIPADTTVNFDAVKPELIKEVIERKTQIEIASTFAKLREQASPRLLLAGSRKTTDIAAEVKSAMAPAEGKPRPDAGPGSK